MTSCDSFYLSPSSLTHPLPSSVTKAQESPGQLTLPFPSEGAEGRGRGYRALATECGLPGPSAATASLGQEGATRDLHVAAWSRGALGHFSEVCGQDPLWTQLLRVRWASWGFAPACPEA